MANDKEKKLKIDYTTPYQATHASRTAFDSSQYDELFKDTPYWDSYQGILNQYARGPEAQFLGFLGADQKNAYNHNQARSNALNALLEQMRTDEYNSPEQQAARERSAGLNPDLTGLSDVGQTDSASTPNHSEMHYENPIPHLVSFLSMLGAGIRGIQELNMNATIQEGADLDNYAKAKSIVLGTLQNFNPHDPVNYHNGIYLQPEFNNSGTSRRSASRLDKVYNQFWGSVEHEIAWRKQHGDKAAERNRLFMIESSPGYSDNDITMRKTASFIADTMLNIQKIELEGQGFGAEATRTRRRIWRNTIQSETGFMKWLRERADKGDVTATRLLLSLIGSDNMNESTGIGGIVSKFIK